MSREQNHVLGLLIALTSLLLLIAAAGKDCWREGAKDPLSSVDLSSRCRGLWGECVYDSMVGLRTCDVSVSYLEKLPADLLAMRLSVLGMCALTLISILVMIPGLDCIKLLPSSPGGSRLLLRVSGALCFCGGVCGTVGLLWYGVETHSRYTQEAALRAPGITFELGTSYWLLVGSVSCSLTSAITTLCSLCRIHDAVRMQTEEQGQKVLTGAPLPTSSYKTYI